MSADATKLLASNGGTTRTPADLRIRVTAGPFAGRSFDVAGVRIVVGRGDSADVRIDDPAVSQFHVELSATAAAIAVHDLGSRNGTFVGDVQAKSVLVPSGTAVRVGSSTLVIDIVPRDAVPEPGNESFGGIIGGAPALRQAVTMLRRLASTDLSVLIEGPTGTGKELAARGLHSEGARAGGTFVTLDCTSIPASLAESILFGHAKGAFTGANESRIGVFEAASGGTVFLDEVGDLGTDIQPKLLRVLERREVVPVGSTQPRAIDVRVVSATWRDLRAMVNRGAFREDLYYRLAQSRVRMPSLDERTEDIRALVHHVLGRIPARVRAARQISNGALDLIAQRSYPGNVRELVSLVERCAMLAEGDTITANDLFAERMFHAEPTRIETRAADTSEAPAATDGEIEAFSAAKKTVIARFEREYLERLLARTGMNVSRAATLAGVDRHTLRDLLKRHGLRAAE